MWCRLKNHERTKNKPHEFTRYKKKGAKTENPPTESSMSGMELLGTDIPNLRARTGFVICHCWFTIRWEVGSYRSVGKQEYVRDVSCKSQLHSILMLYSLGETTHGDIGALVLCAFSCQRSVPYLFFLHESNNTRQTITVEGNSQGNTGNNTYKKLPICTYLTCVGQKDLQIS